MSGRVDVERPDRRLHLAGELLEDEVLVLHLGDEAGGLEQALAVPAVPGSAPTASFHSASAATPVGDVSVGQDVLDVVDQPVVLGVEDLVDRASARCSRCTRPSPQVKCASSISSSYVPAGWRAKSADGVSSASGVGATGGGGRVVVRVHRARVGVVRDVGQERRVEVHDVRPAPATGVGAGCPRRRPVAVHVLRQAAGRARDELAVRVGGEHRDVRSRPCRRAAGRAASAACCLTDAHVPMPSVPSGEPA